VIRQSTPTRYDGEVAVVTGASSGIGEATARSLAGAGFSVVVGARRLDRLEKLAAGLGGGARALPLDVADPGSIAAFVAQVPHLHLLVNNAGGAHGLEPLAETRDEDWQTMWEVNVLGVMRMTRALLPALIRSGDGHVVNLGSVASFETYAGGAGYTAAKHALRAITRTLRLELLGQPVRVTEIDPGMVETEFSRVRFRGDEERAHAVYRGLQPLTGEDIADCIAWAVTRPAHVNVDEMVIRPRDQATVQAVHRRSE
jgi:NADP-dependent 3-hydroxy acid dehydrogenase YdfG